MLHSASHSFCRCGNCSSWSWQQKWGGKDEQRKHQKEKRERFGPSWADIAKGAIKPGGEGRKAPDVAAGVVEGPDLKSLQQALVFIEKTLGDKHPIAAQISGEVNKCKEVPKPAVPLQQQALVAARQVRKVQIRVEKLDKQVDAAKGVLSQAIADLQQVEERRDKWHAKLVEEQAKQTAVAAKLSGTKVTTNWQNLLGVELPVSGDQETQTFMRAIHESIQALKQHVAKVQPNTQHTVVADGYDPTADEDADMLSDDDDEDDCFGDQLREKLSQPDPKPDTKEKEQEKSSSSAASSVLLPEPENSDKEKKQELPAGRHSADRDDSRSPRGQQRP